MTILLYLFVFLFHDGPRIIDYIPEWGPRKCVSGLVPPKNTHIGYILCVKTNYFATTTYQIHIISDCGRNKNDYADMRKWEVLEMTHTEYNLYDRNTTITPSSERGWWWGELKWKVPWIIIPGRSWQVEEDVRTMSVTLLQVRAIKEVIQSYKNISVSRKFFLHAQILIRKYGL